MDLLRRAGKSSARRASPLPTTTPDEDSKTQKPGRKTSSRFAFLRRPMRLRGSSGITAPLGVVLLFPLTVVLLILFLFLGHPSSPGRILMPAGAPPAIRCVS